MIVSGIRFSKLNSLCRMITPCARSLQSSFGYNTINSVKGSEFYNVREVAGLLGHSFHTDNCIRRPNFEVRASAHIFKPSYGSAISPTLSRYSIVSSYPLFKMSPVSGGLSYLSIADGKGDDQGTEVPVVGEGGGGDVVAGNEWVDKLKEGWQSVVDAATVTAQKAKEASDQLTPQAQQILGLNPYLREVVLPVTGMLTVTLLAWLVMPRVLKKLHSYSMKGSGLLSRTGFTVEVPYKKSVWGALVDPVRYLTTFVAFSELCRLVAPDHVVSQYIGHAWKGAIILSFIWFLQRWKTNVVARTLASQNTKLIDRHMLLTLDKVSTVGLLAVGMVALAEVCGVAVQSVLTVGGLGGVATAFAAKDILGNVLSGLSMQFSRPFSLGDTIKAGSVEGEVVEMGLTTTSLLNIDKFPVIVPNSTFSSQVIVNKSRAECRAFNRRIPVQFENIEMIPLVANDIKSMLNSYPNVFLEREAPYCYLSHIESSYAELTVGCNLKRLTRADRYSAEQELLLQSIQIIKQYGLSLGTVQ